jgi:urease accessory protein
LLLNLARFEAPLLLAHCRAAADEDWSALQQFCDEHRASRETRELHQESRQMGYSLQQLLMGLPELDEPARLFLTQQAEPHLALGWALAARAWGISASDALAAWLWSWLENQLAVLMKTLPLGQQAAQRMTSELSPALQQAQQHASNLDLSRLGSAAFGLSLASMAHERQYSRLFRS